MCFFVCLYGLKMVMMASDSREKARSKGPTQPVRVGLYYIEKNIGKGNFAVVKLARHHITKTEVKITFQIPPNLPKNFERRHISFLLAKLAC